MTKKVLTVIAALAFCVGMQAQTLEAEKMTLGGQYAGTCSSPFQGVALYWQNKMPETECVPLLLQN